VTFWGALVAPWVTGVVAPNETVEGVMVRAGPSRPVPSSVTICGEVAASLVIVSVARREPPANGAKTKLRMQVAFGE